MHSSKLGMPLSVWCAPRLQTSFMLEESPDFPRSFSGTSSWSQWEEGLAELATVMRPESSFGINPEGAGLVFLFIPAAERQLKHQVCWPAFSSPVTRRF